MAGSQLSYRTADTPYQPGALGGPRQARGRLVRNVLLGLGLVCIFAGLVLVVVFAETTVNPGGPGCAPQAPCPVSPWYQESTRSAELAVGISFVTAGAILGATYAVLRRARDPSGKSPTPAGR